MYICKNCNATFEQCDCEHKRTTYEDYYGVYDEFESHHELILELCPYCMSEEVEEARQCDICNEWFFIDSLIDTDGMINGNVGYVCEQCLKDNDIE